MKRLSMIMKLVWLTMLLSGFAHAQLLQVDQRIFGMD